MVWRTRCETFQEITFLLPPYSRPPYSLLFRMVRYSLNRGKNNSTSNFNVTLKGKLNKYVVNPSLLVFRDPRTEKLNGNRPHAGKWIKKIGLMFLVVFLLLLFSVIAQLLHVGTRHKLDPLAVLQSHCN